MAKIIFISLVNSHIKERYLVAGLMSEEFQKYNEIKPQYFVIEMPRNYLSVPGIRGNVLSCDRHYLIAPFTAGHTCLYYAVECIY